MSAHSHHGGVHDHAHGHSHSHSHSHGPGMPHPPEPVRWSLLRMTLGVRVLGAVAISCLLWGMVLMVMQ